MNNSNRLMRTSNDKVIGGVCGGLAAYFGIDTTIIRLVFVVAVLSGVSPLLYAVLWIIMPMSRPAVAHQPVAQLPQLVAQQPATQATVVRSPSFYEGQENWKFDPITGETISR